MCPCFRDLDPSPAGYIQEKKCGRDYGLGRGRTGSASSRGSEWFLVAVAVLCFWLSLVLYNVS